MNKKRKARPEIGDADARRQAVKVTGRHILVSAGAGKTTVLVGRFLALAASGQVPVTEILALTFTEKAAHEMKTRLYREFSRLKLEGARRELESAYISTIHAFAARILREHPIEAGLDPDFRVIESEETDYLKEQSAEEVLSERCEKGNEIFEFVRRYGENSVMAGLSAVLDAARQEGKYLAEFFESFCGKNTGAGSEELIARRGADLFEKLGESGLAEEWARFTRVKDWDWEVLDAYREWAGAFALKRGKKGQEEDWREIKKKISPAFLAGKLDAMVKPWALCFEDLAISFERIYEAKKKAKAFLDFDDLQMRAVRLFKKDSPIHFKLRGRYREKFREILVDEFQDTNRLQLELIELLSRGDNLFFVGDFKQSIYAFRGGEPGLFREKENQCRDSENGLRLSLSVNFRSDPEVLDFINVFFENLWKEDGWAYERLESGKGNAPSKRKAVEWIPVEISEGETLDLARMREASQIAGRILRLAGEGTAFGDMAILFQAMSSVGIYEHALKSAGIPYFSVAGSGFYHQPEIRDMVNYLLFIDNPRADIPLAASLRSPLFQVRDETLFWLSHSVKHRGEKDARPLYDSLHKAEGLAQISGPEKEKIGFFLKVSRELLRVKDRLRLSEFLDLVLEKTAYELAVLADPQGTRRYANLKKMIALARELESYEPMRLGAFLRTVRRLQTEEVKESEAQIESEAGGRVVRLMTIHRAKGLEFPVVFLADLGRKKTSEEAAKIVARAGMGYALQAVHPGTLNAEKPAGWLQIYEAAADSQKEEWKRLFYVGATRAKHKLILSGVFDPDKENKDEETSFYKMPTWMEWVRTIAPACGEWMKIAEKTDLPSKRKPAALAEKKNFREFLEAFDSGKPRSGQSAAEDAKGTGRRASEIFAKAYRQLECPVRTIDLPVSAYAVFRKSPEEYRRIYEIGYAGADLRESGEPAEEIFDEDEVSAADFGTRVHALLEHIDFGGPGDSWESGARAFLDDLSGDQKREAAEILARFRQSNLFARLRGAVKVLRELPFVLNERHGLIYGVIDVLYQDPQKRWHLMDYKTAEGDAEKARRAGYHDQMMIYALAFKRLSGIVPRTAGVYFLKNQQEYTLSLSEKALEDFASGLRETQEKILAQILRDSS
jgi:ATP-dependent helicase/nuclease subunit A